MEGWLQVPAERNLMGRGGTWKNRYVKFGTYSPSTPTSVRSANSPIRPTTATGVVSSGVIAGTHGRLSHAPSERKPQVAGSISNGTESGQLPIYLTIYKQKSDAEPIARYPITSIASCYIGDIASRHNKKKSVVLPTLIVNLRAEIQLSSSKSFRRRSHDVPSKEAKKENPGREILYFRPAPDSSVAIEQWAREIQQYLITSSSDSVSSTTIDSSFRDRFSELDFETPPTPSLFFINGEPNTALLSPSLRSQASNLSSIESDDKGSVMSSASEFPSPRMDEDSSRSGGDSRHSLHLATKLRHSVGANSVNETIEEGFVMSPAPRPGRRETILDRYFSSTAPSSPSMASDPAPMNSIARFEALWRDIENGHDLPPNHNSLLMDHPKRIPSPTQRALEYVSTGLLKHSSESIDSPTLAPTFVFQEELAPDKTPSINLSIGSFHHSLSRQASEASLGTTASIAGSIGGAPVVEANLGVSNSKRHSLADFSSMMRPTPPLFQLASSRRGSHSDIPRISESYEDCPSTALPLSPGGGYSNHPRVVTRPLFREFSF